MAAFLKPLSCSPGVLPSVTSLKFHGGLCLGLGTGTGHVLLYDLRSSLPMLVKDHQYDVPIKSLAFHQHPAAGLDLVLSMDRKILKIWDRQTVSIGCCCGWWWYCGSK